MCALAGLSGKDWYLSWDQNDKKQLSEDLVGISRSKYIKYKDYNNVLDNYFQRQKEGQLSCCLESWTVVNGRPSKIL